MYIHIYTHICILGYISIHSYIYTYSIHNIDTHKSVSIFSFALIARLIFTFFVLLEICCVGPKNDALFDQGNHKLFLDSNTIIICTCIKYV